MDRVATVLAAQALRAEHFYIEVHRLLFAAILALHEKAVDVDPITLSDQLKRDGALEAVGGLQFIYDIAGSVPTAANVEHHARIVLTLARQRQLVSSMHKALADLERGPAESLDELDTHLAVMESDYRQGRPMGQADMVEYTECLIDTEIEQQRGLLTGYGEMDKHIDLRPGQILTIYGDTGSKKTTLAMNFVARWARDSQIAVYNYEQKPVEIARLVSDCDVYAKIPTGNLWISPNPPPIESLPAQIRAIKLKRGLDGIVLDYIQTIPAITRQLAEDENNLVRYTMRAMRDLAQRESIWVIVVAQMRKSTSDTQEHQLNPSIDRMRGSGEIKMASSLILSVVLPLKCGVRTIDSLSTENLMNVRIKKNRDCLTGNPGEEREIRLVHQLNNRLITSFDAMEAYMPPGGFKG